MARLVVGCPLWDRNWILPTWFAHVERAVSAAGFDPRDVMTMFIGDHADRGFALAVGESWRRGWDCHTVDMIEEPGDRDNRDSYSRVWYLRRYEHMADLRNNLLRDVRRWSPDLYWSLDSDILVNENALALAMDAIDTRGFDAVGQRCYMTPVGLECPSYAMLNGGGLLRPDSEGCFPVNVIMASKVMTPAAYAVNYAPHQQGEDIGWSIACAHKGLTLGWDGRSVSKHVMEPHHLERVDARCGW